ncbi:hypothetical protein [Nonomuraea sp. NPDC046570]|uniref:hypothetical protein n=1 Tax=Nonomuraea sp. NPDC046570 TaxID=3155255 RepID=UPI0033E9050A
MRALRSARLVPDCAARVLPVWRRPWKSHVRASLQKLDLRDRVHVVIYAYENGLVARHEFHPDGWYRVHPFG